MWINEMHENFLIIGFTGPLRSGCTTAANVLINNLSQRITEKSSLISKCQEDIIKTYCKISDEKKTRKSIIDDLFLDRKTLLNFIKMRHILSALSLHKGDTPIYISMTEMLLKTVIEYYWQHKNSIKINAKDPDDKKNSELILEQISNSNFDYLDRIIGTKDHCINNIIKKRKYHELSPDKADNIKLYKKYLSDITSLRQLIQDRFNTIFKEKGGERYGKILQDIGDNIRRCLKPFDYLSRNNGTSSSIWKLSEQANDLIKFHKNCYRFWEGRKEYDLFKAPHIFVIENFRNPFEAEYFRLRYYEFFLISVHCNSKERLRREYEANPIYRKRKLSQEQIEPYFHMIDRRDSGEDNKYNELHKQNVRDAVHLADIAIINEQKMDDFQDKVLKYYTLIRNPGAFHPSNDELFMHIAYSMSLRSKCISRKVGAVIVGERGYIIGAGWNEVGEGQIGCGDRIIQDIVETNENCIPIEVKGKTEFRTYLLKKYGSRPNVSFCFREEYEKYLNQAKTSSGKSGEKRNIFQSVAGSDSQQSSSKFKAQQFCRALHAEENAIIQTAKLGGVGVLNGTIYTTTFPCELCAKKIYQSGIKKIIYTEPYPDAISEDVFLGDGIKTVEIQPFEGVKSHSYYRLYKPEFNVKDLQKIKDDE
jgi:deoxycytidylate deaminase